MDAPLLLFAVIRARRRRRELRARRRQIRDASNPFELPDVEFIQLYRIPKEGIQYLIEEIGPMLPQTRRSTGIPPFIRVLTAVNFLACGGYQRGIGQDFHHALSQPAVSICIKQVCDAINSRLLGRWVKFPKTPEEVDRIKVRYMEKTGMPGVIGAVDGTHVAIVPPIHEREHLYVNRKHFHSINVMIVCDYDLRITTVNARHEGSKHDANVWQRTLCRDYLQREYNAGRRSKWLLGDSGYPNEPWLLTPFRNPLPDSPEARFNISQLRARNSVERCIGVLKGWFRCLKRDRTLHYTPLRAGIMVNTCVILHNMALHYRVPLPQNIELEEEEIIFNFPAEMNVAREGSTVRGTVVRNYFY